MIGEEKERGGDAPRMVQDLTREHASFRCILDLLEREIDVFERAGKPDYEIVEAILAYCLGYPDECHHPKEDAVLSKLRARDPDTAAEVGDLEGEHRELAALARRLADSVGQILMEVELPRGWLAESGRRFVTAYRRHMEREEATFFPAAARVLAPQDWAGLAERRIDPEDPLFGVETERRFEALRREIHSLSAERADG